MIPVYIVEAFKYIVDDPYFWPSMAFTTMVGIYVGAILYNGDVEQVRKGIIGLLSYTLLLVVTLASRVLPKLGETSLVHQPLAGLETVLVVTAAYLVGMLVGVKTVKHARRSIR